MDLLQEYGDTVEIDGFDVDYGVSVKKNLIVGFGNYSASVWKLTYLVGFSRMKYWH